MAGGRNQRQNKDYELNENYMLQRSQVIYRFIK